MTWLTVVAAVLSLWRPTPGLTWQYQLQGEIDLSVQARVYDVDGFETSAETVAALHARGRKVVCYISAGSWEEWRPDADRFPQEAIGKPLAGWPGERWVDMRRLDVLGPILRDRMEMCREKGFDAVEPDNVDATGQDTGFAITAADRLRFARWLARTGHELGLAVGLKNNPGHVKQLVRDFDFAVVEECFEFRECERYAPFVRARKAVFAVEYRLPPSRFCAQAKRLRFSAIRKSLDLTAPRQACP